MPSTNHRNEKGFPMPVNVAESYRVSIAIDQRAEDQLAERTKALINGTGHRWQRRAPAARRSGVWIRLRPTGVQILRHRSKLLDPFVTGLFAMKEDHASAPSGRPG